MSTQLQIVLDCSNSPAQAEFWAGALGYVVQPPPEGFDAWPDFLRNIGVPEELWESRSAIIDPEGARPRIYFQNVPEAKTVKNRVHLDIQVGAGLAPEERRGRVSDEVTRLTDLGATERQVFNQMGEHWVVMTDPEGNEFCVS